METKYIFVLGAVVSSIGKGVTAASIGRLLKDRGFSITMQKMDPYLNVTPAALSPLQHGETFILTHGLGADLDLGTYERFLDTNLPNESSVTSGRIYKKIFQKEEEGYYAGKTIQVVPHFTDEIKNTIYALAQEQKADIVIVEVGGSIGDIEQGPYLEAVRQVRSDVGKENTLYVCLSYLPYVNAAAELKTKPTQHGIATLRSYGIQPDILICRHDSGDLNAEAKKKISLFCDVDTIIENKTVQSILEVPIMFKEQGLDNAIVQKLNLPQTPSSNEWIQIVERYKNTNRQVKIAVVGKYTDLPDAYKSVTEALAHGGIANDVHVKVDYIYSGDSLTEEDLKNYSGIVLPDNTGIQGTRGMIDAAKIAREHKIPCFGIGMGMQCMVLEYARNILDLKGAGSLEFGKTEYPVIVPLDHKSTRLGAYTVVLDNNSISMDSYGTGVIQERYNCSSRINPFYAPMFRSKQLIFAGKTKDDTVIVELPKKIHPWYVGTQFRPEFLSRPNRVAPLFRSFIKACKKQ